MALEKQQLKRFALVWLALMLVLLPALTIYFVVVGGASFGPIVAAWAVFSLGGPIGAIGFLVFRRWAERRAPQ